MTKMRIDIHTCCNWALVDGDCSGHKVFSELTSYFSSFSSKILLMTALVICNVCLSCTPFST